MEKPKLLIVEDDEEIRMQMKWAMTQDYDVALAHERKGALELFKAERPAVVTLDLGLPPQPRDVEEGFRTLYDILHEDPHTKLIVITGRDGQEHALQAIAQGAYDYLRKPVCLDELQVIVRRALHVYQLEQEYCKLQQQVCTEAFEGMLGTSAPMQEVFATIRKVSAAEASVLIVGESGTG
jgi:two-component system NtrC family response regulator